MRPYGHGHILDTSTRLCGPLEIWLAMPTSRIAVEGVQLEVSAQSPTAGADTVRMPYASERAADVCT